MNKKKIKAFMFDFPNGNVFCVGSELTINYLCQNFAIQRDLNKNIEVNIWTKHFINNKIYSYFTPKNIQGIIPYIYFYYYLKKNNLWIKKENFTEALYYSNPKEIKEILKLTNIDEEIIIKENFWNNKF